MNLGQVSEILGGEKVLGRQIETQMDLVQLGDEGITKKVIINLQTYLALPWKKMVSLLPVTDRTLQRYGKTKHLSPEVSQQILIIAELVVRGVDVFGDKERFLNWMNTPCLALSNKLPLNLIKSRLGHEMVLDQIGRIEHGVFS